MAVYVPRMLTLHVLRMESCVYENTTLLNPNLMFYPEYSRIRRMAAFLLVAELDPCVHNPWTYLCLKRVTNA